MRIAMLLNFSPRKLGTFEDWLVALADQARGRGHALHFYGRAPVHEAFAARLRASGAEWLLADALEARPMAAVRRLRRYHTLYLHMVSIRHPLARLCHAAWPARVLLCDHSDWPPEFTERSARAAGRRTLDRIAFLRVNALATVSEFIATRDRAHFLARPDRLWTIYNGVDLRRFKPPPAYERSEPVVLTVAYFVPFKGVGDLIQAYAPLASRARLQVVGDGPELEQLQGLARELGIERRVDFFGLCDDVEARIAASDVFVHPSWREAFGLTVAEAMACARPVIATRVGGIPELITDGENGLLVPPQQPEAIRAALERLLEDAELRTRLGAAARRTAEARFGIDRSASRHLEFCEAFGLRRKVRATEGLRLAVDQPT